MYDPEPAKPGRKPNPLKALLRGHSMRYYTPSWAIDDPELAKQIGVPLGTMVARLDLDLAMMEPAQRAALEERLLRYHTPTMQAVSADLSVTTETLSLEARLAALATANSSSNTSTESPDDPPAH